MKFWSFESLDQVNQNDLFFIYLKKKSRSKKTQVNAFILNLETFESWDLIDEKYLKSKRKE